jgi:hypothetical protein
MFYKLGALGQTADSSATDTTAAPATGWLQNLITGITQYKVGQQQLDAISQVNQINIQRAAAGLPPIAMPTLGQPGVNIGLSSDVQTLLMYGALGVGALVVLNMFLKRR